MTDETGTPPESGSSREPPVAMRRTPSGAAAAAGARRRTADAALTGGLRHPSLVPDHRFLPFPATGDESDPYFAGYLGALSATHGDPLVAHVATRSGADCFADVYRVTGCADARLTPRLRHVRRLGPLAPHRLPRSARGRRLSSLDCDAEGCRWPGAELLAAVPADWPSGLYLVQFTAADEPRGRTSERAGEDALFVVRNDGAHEPAALLYQVNVATWAAYHMWHDRTLYMGRTESGERFDELRNATASLQRPGLGLCLPNETILTPAPPKATYAFAFVDWAEREGISFDVCTGLDVSAGRAGLDRYRALLTVGHDEYWTAEQQEAVQAYRARGGHTVFLGGNLAYWQIRATSDGSAVACHKNASDGELLDPLLTAEPVPGTPPLTGETWRVRDGSSIPTTGVYNFARRPSAPDDVLTGGAMWWWEELGGPPRPALGFTVCDPDHWAFAGTGLAAGDAFGAVTKLVGHEADGLEVAWEDDSRACLTFADGALPGTELLALADCRDWSEWDFGAWPPTVVPGRRESSAALGGVVTMIHRRAPGEGMLFAAATTEWVFGLLPSLDWTATRALDAPVLPADPVVAQITRNVLRACLER